MKNYYLTFFDKKIENQYFEFQLAPRNMTFKLLTFGLLLTYLIRILMCLIDDNYQLIQYKLSMVFYLVAQYWFIQWKQHLIRVALIITNISTIGFILDDEQQTQVQNLRASNIMALNLMIILTGEFVDAILQIMALTVLRIFITFQHNQINYPIFLSAIFVNLSILYYVYAYHKGKRSQFLLGLVETGWDKIFFQIIKESCVLLEFSYQNFNFIIQKFKKFPFHQMNRNTTSQSKEQIIYDFLCNSSLGPITFQSYLFECIKQFQEGDDNHLFKTISIKFKRHVYIIDISIFQTKSPMVLLQLQQKNKMNLKQLKIYRRRFFSLNNTFLHILSKIENEVQNTLMIKQMRRKLMIVKIMEELLYQDGQFNQVNTYQTVSQIKQLYPDRNILFENTHHIQTIYTIPNAFFLLILNVIENSQIDIVQVRLFKIESEQSYILEFTGNFKQNQIKKIYQNTRYQTRLIISDLYISKHLVQFILYSDPLCTSADDLFTYEYQDLLLSNEL